MKQKLETLDKDGFVYICNIFDDENMTATEFDECCEIVETRNFKKMCQLGDDKLMPTLQKHLGWSSPRYGLTFMSNNDNPQAWHRDLYSKDKSVYPEQYTLLLYLDETSMYVFKGTHKKPVVNLTWYLDGSSFTSLQPKKGDVILIWSHIIHRGHFDTVFKHRRMIQFFEVFPNQQKQDEIDRKRQFLQLDAGGNKRQSRVKLLKVVHSWAILHAFMQLFTFILLALNLHQYQPTVYCRKKQTSNDDGVFVSYGSFKYPKREEFFK